MNLSYRVAKLEQDGSEVSYAYYQAAIKLKLARLRAELCGDETLPPAPPRWMIEKGHQRWAMDTDAREKLRALRRLFEGVKAASALESAGGTP